MTCGQDTPATDARPPFDLENELLAEYTYDLEDPLEYQSNNNRLMKYTVTDVSGTPALVSTTYYYYDEKGNPLRIVTEQVAAPNEYLATRFVYDGARRAAVVIGETWEDGEDCPAMNYAVVYARAFRYEYDDPRERYMEADLDCEDLGTTVETRWSDYLGGSIYADFVVTESGGNPVYTNQRAFLPGVAVADPPGSTTGLEYYHADHLGTTRSMSDTSGDDQPGTAGGVVYTAFGEPINDAGYRYGYIGAWGYRAHDDLACDEGPAYEFPYLHVGFRYYDPASGRFLQRDPIGIRGGFNVYSYVDATATAGFDPLGLRPPEGEDAWDRYYEDRLKLTPEQQKGLDIFNMACGAIGVLLYVAPGIVVRIVADIAIPDPPQREPVQPTLPEPPDFDWDKESPGPEDIDEYW